MKFQHKTDNNVCLITLALLTSQINQQLYSKFINRLEVSGAE